jgi:hypothetical protein
MNEESSRSHSVFQMSITYNNINDFTIKKSKLFLVDLAGSERATASAGHQLKRIEEGKAINLSLSSLGNCMNALAEKRKHIPYRDSKLTRLLQGSLGGGARTCVLVTLPPGDCDSDKLIINVLRFASRAITIKVAAKVSRFVDYESLYQEAMCKLDSYEDEKNAGLVNASHNEDLQDEVDRQKEHIRELMKQNEFMKVQLESQNNDLISNSSRSSSSGGNSYDPSFNRPSATSKDPVDLERYWRNEIQKITEKSTKDLKDHRYKFETKINTMNKTLDESTREILILTNDLSDERTKHLNTLNDVKKYQQKFIHCV